MLNCFDITGKTAIVTGASKGLGEGFAHALAQSGAELFLVARHAEELMRVSEDIRARYAVPCKWCAADIAEPEDPERIASACVDAFGKIDILINNAAAMRLNKPPQETTAAEFESVMYPNVIGTFALCRAVGAVMRKRKQGKIVNISSMSAQIVNRGVYGGSYEVSKAALAMLTKTLAVEWAGDGINVNTICPGYYGTAPNRAFFAADPAFESKVLDMIPMHRLGLPQELWGALILLCSPASDYMQGSMITVDGGYTLW